MLVGTRAKQHLISVQAVAILSPPKRVLRVNHMAVEALLGFCVTQKNGKQPLWYSMHLLNGVGEWFCAVASFSDCFNGIATASSSLAKKCRISDRQPRGPTSKIQETESPISSGLFTLIEALYVSCTHRINSELNPHTFSM